MKKVEVAILSYKKYNVNVFYIFVLLTWLTPRFRVSQLGVKPGYRVHSKDGQPNI